MSAREFTKEEQERIYAVKAIILNGLNKKLTIKQLARQAALGERRFREGFYKLFGMTIARYIRIARMHTGRFLLTHTEKTIKEIGRVCGYKRYKSFLKAYKKFFGSSAGTERKR